MSGESPDAHHYVTLEVTGDLDGDSDVDGMADPDHELIRFGARDYPPSTGRWMGRDPIFFRGGLNLYGYAHNDPIFYVDYDGQEADKPVGQVAPQALAGKWFFGATRVRNE